MKELIIDEFCEECKQKYKQGKPFWMCEICRKIFEPEDDLGLNCRKG